MKAMEYDPETCITAAELRAVGVSVAADLPGCAWVPRAAMCTTVSQPSHAPEEIKNGILRTDFTISFSEPFRWVSASFIVQSGARHRENL